MSTEPLKANEYSERRGCNFILSVMSDSKPLGESRKKNQPPKRRKFLEKTVVAVKIEENVGKQKAESPPSDLWSWRKYGQKPIKGSPHPRGYYRCSTSKGCSAKKQVEKCRTDASVLIITYTSSHNHPGPFLHKPLQTPQTKPAPHQAAAPANPCHHQEQSAINGEEEHLFSESIHRLQSPIDSLDDLQHEPHLPAMARGHEPMKLGLLFDEEPLSNPHIMTFSSSKLEDEDFFDELEELPVPSSFASLVRTCFFDERVLV